MKKTYMIFLLILLVLLMACSKESDNRTAGTIDLETITEEDLKEMVELLEEYAEEEEEVVDDQEEVTNVKEGFKLYSDYEISLEFIYPEDWIIQASGLVAPDKPKEHVPSFAVTEFENEYNDVHSFAEAKFQSPGSAGFELLEEKVVLIDGREALLKKFKRYRFSDMYHEIIVFITDGDAGYRILYSAVEDIYDEYESIALEMIDSIRFKDLY